MRPNVIKFRVELEGEIMSTASASYTVSVTPVGPPPPPQGVITINPPSGSLPDEVEGVATNDKVCDISVDQNVVLPLNYQFTDQPPGVTFNEVSNADGSFSIFTNGAPNVGDATNSPYTINLVVTDSAPAPAAKASASVRVLH